MDRERSDSEWDETNGPDPDEEEETISYESDQRARSPTVSYEADQRARSSTVSCDSDRPVRSRASTDVAARPDVNPNNPYENSRWLDVRFVDGCPREPAQQYTAIDLANLHSAP